MARVVLSRHINAPRERVWEIVSDLDTQHRWMEDVHKLDVVYRTPEGRGTVIKALTKLFGVPLIPDVLVITRWDPPSTIEILHCGQFSGSGAFRLEPAEDGGTVFIWEEEFDPPLGAVGDFAADKVVVPHLEEVWGRSMENVRRLAEGSGEA